MIRRLWSLLVALLLLTSLVWAEQREFELEYSDAAELAKLLSVLEPEVVCSELGPYRIFVEGDEPQLDRASELIRDFEAFFPHLSAHIVALNPQGLAEFHLDRDKTPSHVGVRGCRGLGVPLRWLNYEGDCVIVESQSEAHRVEFSRLGLKAEFESPLLTISNGNSLEIPQRDGVTVGFYLGEVGRLFPSAEDLKDRSEQEVWLLIELHQRSGQKKNRRAIEDD